MSTILLGQRIGKLKGHAEHLLDLFRRLRARFAFLEPMLFDSDVVATHSQGRKGHGFGVIRDTLLYACVQDIANLTTDKDHRTPSIAKIMADLEDPAILARLRDDFSSWSLPPDPSWEPDVADVVRRNDQARKPERFDARYAGAVAGWE